MHNMYQQILMDHFKNPRRHFPLPAYDLCLTGANPLCGDSVTIYLARRQDGELTADNQAPIELSFEGKGCAISMASASIMAESLHGKGIATCHAMMERFHAMIEARESKESATQTMMRDEDEDMAALSTIHRYPARHGCALLAWKTLADALEQLASATAQPADARSPHKD